jgi:hypothetical protein
MKYLRRIDEARVTWADKIKENSLRIINSALRQNPEININDIKDVLLELFDMIGLYPDPHPYLFFKKESGNDWSGKLKIDPNSWRYEKKDYFNVEKFLQSDDLLDPTIAIVFDGFGPQQIDTFNRKIKELEIDKKYLDIKKECYERLGDMGYNIENSKEVTSAFNNNIFIVTKTITYNHLVNTNYMDGLPEDITKELHKFMTDKSIEGKDAIRLVNIFKKAIGK